MRWSQAELAERVGMGQQAVSNWENGRSQPAAPVLELLRTLLHAPLTVPPRPTPAVPPARLKQLPLKWLDQDRFVQLAAAVLSVAHPGARIEADPGAGEGVHYKVEVRPGMRRIGVRCTTTGKFHPSSFDKTAAAVRWAADQYLLLLNGRATARVRQRAAATRWEVLDAHDMSALLLGAPAPVLDAVVGDYFPGVHVHRAPGQPPALTVAAGAVPTPADEHPIM